MRGGDESGLAVETALTSAACAVMVCDAAPSGARIRFVNVAFTALTGYSSEEAIGRKPSFLQGPNTDRAVVTDIREALAAGLPVCRELLNYRKNGLPFWNRMTITPIQGGAGEIHGFLGLALDADAAPQLPQAPGTRDAVDQLTGLATREVFRNRLRAAIGQATLAAPIAVYCLDIDDFQDVNESCGEAAGDEVLRRIAARLSSFAARGHVARIGGDEFAVLMPAPADGRAAMIGATARALCQLVREPITIAGQPLVVRGSLGVTVFPAPEPAYEASGCDLAGEAMKQADLALQAAKQEEPGDYRLYDAPIDHRRRKRLALRHSLTEAIVGEQFELHYQPIVVLGSGAIAGAEALVRWNHPTLGIQYPETFIPMAEASGLILPLGDWVLGQALKQGAAWRRQGLPVGRIAINLSSLQLRRGPQRPDFLLAVEAALADTGADPHGFDFELTEGTIIESSEEIVSTLRALKAMGFGISIDDFGTGHASFRYLRDLLFDKVKVDKSFIGGIGEDGESEAIVSAMIRLVRMLGAQVVGEGVESALHRDFLCEQGCDFAQGYLFSPPVGAEAFAAMVRSGLTLPLSPEGPRMGAA